MDKRDLEQLLSDVAGGSVTPADALTRIQTAPTADLGFAQLDLSRGVRPVSYTHLDVYKRQVDLLLGLLDRKLRTSGGSDGRRQMVGDGKLASTQLEHRLAPDVSGHGVGAHGQQGLAYRGLVNH